MTDRRTLALTLAAACSVLAALPAVGIGSSELEQNVQRSIRSLDQTVSQTAPASPPAVQQAGQNVQRGVQQAVPGGTRQQTPAGNPQLQPPLNGTNPHGQGAVALTDLDPDPARPQGSDPAGSDTGEEVVVGRSRGEQMADGSYRGRITILALQGEEILDVDTGPGEGEGGPLDAVQVGVLDPVCAALGQQARCLEVLAADSVTSQNSSMNRFAVARAQVENISVGAAESQGNISNDQTCQTSTGTSSVADANVGGVTADAAQAESTSQACNDGRAPTTQSNSRVINLGGTGVPLPAAGCDTGAETLVPLVVVNVVCNATDTGTNFSVREALDVFVLPVAVGNASLTKLTTAEAESLAVAPARAVTPPTDDGGGGGDNGDDAGDRGDRADEGAERSPGGGDEAECTDGDPQCESRSDDSESGGARAAGLPFSGVDVLGIVLAGALALAGGLLLRRRGELPGAS